MFENRNLKLDLLALGLLGIVIFLAVSLFTYEPSDPIGEIAQPLGGLYQPDQLVYPLGEEVTNACGWWGAFAADVLLNLLGVGAYYLLVSAAILDGVLLLRRTIDAPVMRLVGWLGSLFGVTTLAALLVPGWSPGPVIGAGGYLGVTGMGLMETHFALAGSLILASSIMIGGLLLCTDYAILRVLGRGANVAGNVATKGHGALKRRAEKRSALADRGEAESEEDSQESLAVRIRGRDVDPDDAEVAEEEELLETEPAEDLEEELEEEPEEDVIPLKVRKRMRRPAPGVAKRPHFRLKKRFQKDERDEVMEQLDHASSDEPGEYELPDVNLLIEADDICFDEQVKEVRHKAKILERTFANFGFTVRVVEIETGPVIAQYEVELEAGLRLSKITGLADDLAIALRVPSVRIVAPIPGKNTVGIEVPNETRQVVRLREVIEETNGKARKMKIPLFLGKDVSGNPLTVDLSTLPHLLIAGRTGTGKSVCLNAIISSILMTRKPDEVRLLLIDPKMVELSGYGRLPHLMHPVVTDMRKAEAILAWAVEKMEERYSLLARAGVRHISGYNQLDEEELMKRFQPETDEEREAIPKNLPFIVIVADEMADLMMTAGKEVEQHIIRLAQKSRAVGIHLILATQKPTVDVITGLIKSNLPARVSFQVASRTDSRVVLDEMGADKLLGNGDMLFLWPGTSSLLRGQGTYLTDDEINRLVDNVCTGEQNFVHELVNLKVEDPEDAEAPGPLKKRDELYESAVDVVVREGRGSVSLLQRTLGIGYGRAARLIDFMAEDGIVGAYAGSQAREVLISVADWDAMQGQTPEPESNTADSALGTRKRSNRIVPDPERRPGSADEYEDEWADEEEQKQVARNAAAPWEAEDAWDDEAGEDHDEPREQDAYTDLEFEEYDDEEYEEEEYEAESA
jgi:S-DNA-T family DNA segregation ATPase FtsK/SpoIIIE